MDGRLVYQSLQEAVAALVDYANKLDDPIDLYMKQLSQLGEDGASAWGGTAATSVMPILNAIKADIVELQEASKDFSDKVNVASKLYTTADQAGRAAIESLKDGV